MTLKDVFLLSCGFVSFFIITPLLMLLVSNFYPYEFLVKDWSTLLVSSVLVALGIYLCIMANLALYKVGHGIASAIFKNMGTQSTHLVTSFPYNICRNPMHLGIFMMYLGLAIFFNSIWCLLICLLFLIMFYIYAIVIDEKRLMRDFKSEFIAYKNKVPRFFPRIFYGR